MSSEFRPVTPDRTSAGWISFVFFAMLLFWGLRVAYWSSVEEQPFSDMGNFDATARGIATTFNFQWSEFWKTYSTPSLVAARALQIILFGDSMLAWRFFLAALTFLGLLWLGYEMWKVTGSRWIVGALLMMVALSQPSIFWSLKLSREGFQEAATYFTIAVALFALRRASFVAYFALGLILAINFLNRPNSLLIVPLIVLIVVGVHLRLRRTAPLGLTAKLVALTFGIAVLWGPWILRSVMIYGEPVLLSTQGPYTLLWELGEVRVRLGDGTDVRTDVNTLQAEAPNHFPHDLAASRYASQIARAWLTQNRAELPRITLRRISRTVGTRGEYLTRVPRDRIFGKPFDYLLLDKNRPTIYSGAFGLILFSALYGLRLFVLPLAVLIPWLSGAAMLSYPRMLEAAIPLILFGNVAWLVWIARWIRSQRGELQPVPNS